MREPAGWATALGQVMVANIQAREFGGLDEGARTTVGNFPRIVYEYEVAGKRYVGERFKAASALTEIPNYRLAETLARYPVGSVVQIRYDPVDPGNAVLEVEPLFRVALGGAFGVLLFVSGIFSILDVNVSALVARFLPPFGSIIDFDLPHIDRTLVTEAGGLGLVLALCGAIWLWRVIVMRSWPVIPGLILSSQVEMMEWRRPFGFRVIYRYEVDGREYRSNRIKTFSPSSSSPWLARKVVDRYPSGSTVSVRYNPKNHAESIVEPGGLGPLIFIVVAGAFLLIAVSASR